MPQVAVLLGDVGLRDTPRAGRLCGRSQHRLPFGTCKGTVRHLRRNAHGPSPLMDLDHLRLRAAVPSIAMWRTDACKSWFLLGDRLLEECTLPNWGYPVNAS